MLSSLKCHVMILSLSIVGTVAQAAERPAADNRVTASGVSDVSLSATNGLAGRYLDGEGRGIDGAVVTVLQADRVIAQTTTSQQGAYYVEGLRPGVYQLTLGDQAQTIRVWNEAAAPPAARRLLTIVRQDQIVRGQFGLIAGSVGSTIGAVGGVAGVAAGGYSINQSLDARDDADEAMKESAHLRDMLMTLMSP